MWFLEGLENTPLKKTMKMTWQDICCLGWYCSRPSLALARLYDCTIVRQKVFRTMQWYAYIICCKYDNMLYIIPENTYVNKPI